MLDWQVELALGRYHERVREVERQRLRREALRGQSRGLGIRAMAFAGRYLVLAGHRMEARAGVVTESSAGLVLLASQTCRELTARDQDTSDYMREVA